MVEITGFQLPEPTGDAGGEEVVEVEEEYEVEEMQKREKVQEVVEETKVSQVKANYPYKGQQGMSAAKGEVWFT